MEDKERLAALEGLVGRVATDVRYIVLLLEGGDQPGLRMRVDRLEVESVRKGKLIALLSVPLGAILLKVGYDFVVQIIRSSQHLEPALHTGPLW